MASYKPANRVYSLLENGEGSHRVMAYRGDISPCQIISGETFEDDAEVLETHACIRRLENYLHSQHIDNSLTTSPHHRPYFHLSRHGHLQ
jgi:hypothetical protein